jgi:hypothetical protein
MCLIVCLCYIDVVLCQLVLDAINVFTELAAFCYILVVSNLLCVCCVIFSCFCSFVELPRTYIKQYFYVFVALSFVCMRAFDS